MARVAQDAKLRRSIDHSLGYLAAEWGGIPEAAAEWNEWDLGSRLTFIENWAVPSDRLGQLRRWAAEGLLGPEQQRQYEELEHQVARLKPLLERLLAV